MRWSKSCARFRRWRSARRRSCSTIRKTPRSRSRSSLRAIATAGCASPAISRKAWTRSTPSARRNSREAEMKTRKAGAIRIGGGSGFSNDRVDAALELVERGDIDVLMLETLAERTLALLQVAKRKGGSGYWDNLAGRLEVLLPAMARHRTKFVTNAGGAEPEACARMIAG